ncbi:MAG TPA: M20/M25/M40 family metallo-hydrolase [Candidatus Binataceae bacterium]|nr:M20/M25/M40 family metallo-hydrolase [Candidatus Binataceae bacterium]
MNEQTLAWCKRLIGCRSVTGDGTREIADLCARELLTPRGIEPQLAVSQVEGGSQVNLIAKVGGQDSSLAPIVLNTHLDTVPPGDTALWTECPDGPFAANVKQERIYGLGAADTKLDFVAKALAVAEVGKPRRQVYLIATFGEEHGLVGAKEIAAAGMLPKGALAFIGEPSGLKVITAHKGLMVFRLELRFPAAANPAPTRSASRARFAGRSAHSSTPALGLNAIRLAIDTMATRADLRVISIAGGDAVNKVPARCDVIIDDKAPIDIANGAVIEKIEAPAPSLIPVEAVKTLSRFIADLTAFADRAGALEPDYAHPTLTCNPGVIRSSADSLTLDFELRPPPALALDRVREGVAALAQKLASESPDIALTVTELRANPGFRSTLDGETVELAMAALAAAKLPLDTGVKAGCTEAGIYAAAGLRPVVFGPGPSTGVIHAPNEYNFLAEVDAALQFYRELLRL